MTANDAPLPFDRLGSYRILDRLGRGGMGEVYVAQREGSTNLCALKRLRSDSGDPMGLRMRREAHVTMFLDHPCIARVLDAKELDGAFCIATELIRGVTLEQLMYDVTTHGKKFSLGIVARIAADILDALVYAQSAVGPDGPLEIVHRDIAPKNVLIGFDGSIKLIDFGLVRAAVDGGKTTPGALMGTPAYIAPEQALGEAVDGRTDVYAAAVIIHELLVHRRAVRDGSVSDMLHHVVTEPLPRPSTIVSGLDPRIDEVMKRALEKSPDDRLDAPGFRHGLGVAFPKPASRQVLSQLVSTYGKESRAKFDEWDRMIEAPTDAGDLNAPTRVAEARTAVTRESPVRPRRTTKRLVPVAIGLGLLAATVVAVTVLMSRPTATAPIAKASSTPIVVAPRVTPTEPEPTPSPTAPRKPTRAPRVRRPRPPPATVKPPALAPAPKRETSVATHELTRLRKKFREDGNFDVSSMSRLIDRLERSAKELGDATARDAVRRARGCLRTCRDMEKLLARAATAVEAVDEAQRTAE